MRRPVLFDAKADILVHGMGEAAVREIARRLDAGRRIDDAGFRGIPGTAVVVPGAAAGPAGSAVPVELPSFEEVRDSAGAFNRAFAVACREANASVGRPLSQRCGGRQLLVNPPAPPLCSAALDRIHELPFRRAAHPSYREAVPALETVRWSMISHRGCYGGCSFCALYFHQGPVIQSRSIDSLVREAAALAARNDFRGTITDVGGPTANMYGTNCRSDRRDRDCRRRSCLAPRVCPGLKTDQFESIRMWRAVASVPGVKRLFVASGVRHDLALRDRRYLAELVRSHIGGHLKVAPEHCSPRVLTAMNKPEVGTFLEFLEAFRQCRAQEQYLVPYLISSHPGCGYGDMLALREFLRRHRLRVEQVQDFIPLPMTASAAMYHTRRDPFTGEKVYVERDPAGKQRQWRLLATAGDGLPREDGQRPVRKGKRPPGGA